MLGVGRRYISATIQKFIVPLPGAGMVRLGGDQVAAGDQLVAFDAGVVVDGPLIIFENLGGVEGQPVEIEHIG